MTNRLFSDGCSSCAGLGAGGSRLPRICDEYADIQRTYPNYSGSVTTNEAPCSRMFFTAMVPPCASTMRFAMLSPRPKPRINKDEARRTTGPYVRRVGTRREAVQLSPRPRLSIGRRAVRDGQEQLAGLEDHTPQVGSRESEVTRR
jgi:hypothetical protein